MIEKCHRIMGCQIRFAGLWIFNISKLGHPIAKITALTMIEGHSEYSLCTG